MNRQKACEMTPLELQIVIHYYVRADDFPRGDFPAVREAIDWMTRAGLLRKRGDGDEAGESTYLIDARGRAFVEALCQAPLPEQRWVVPSQPPRMT